MSIILEASDLNLRFGGVQAANGASLKVSANERIAIIGPKASKAERSTSIMSRSKRTGTSKAKPALTSAPAAGACPMAKVSKPVE